MDDPQYAAIALDSVSKRYGGREVVHGITLTVPAGESLALVGPNGAGKTTLMKMILGVTRPSAGRVRLHGVDPCASFCAASRSSIGYLPENVAFNGAMTGAELLAFYARLKGEAVSVCERLLARVGLSEAASRRVRTYSKGMRQRLGLAQALLGRPRLLVLDEPTSGLDPTLREHFYRILAEQHSAGTTALISSHALTEIEGRVDRIAIVKDGSLLVCGTLEELRARASLPVRVRLMVDPGTAGAVATRIGHGIRFSHVNDRTIDLHCLNGDKMTVVRRIAELGQPVNDVDILPPGLDQIYAHFAGEEEAR
jgi:Cu-processing system ATP-binding protein